MKATLQAAVGRLVEASGARVEGAPLMSVYVLVVVAIDESKQLCREYFGVVVACIAPSGHRCVFRRICMCSLCFFSRVPERLPVGRGGARHGLARSARVS